MILSEINCASNWHKVQICKWANSNNCSNYLSCLHQRQGSDLFPIASVHDWLAQECLCKYLSID